MRDGVGELQPPVEGRRKLTTHGLRVGRFMENPSVEVDAIQVTAAETPSNTGKKRVVRKERRRKRMQQSGTALSYQNMTDTQFFQTLAKKNFKLYGTAAISCFMFHNILFQPSSKLVEYIEEELLPKSFDSASGEFYLIGIHLRVGGYGGLNDPPLANPDALVPEAVAAAKKASALLDRVYGTRRKHFWFVATDHPPLRRRIFDSAPEYAVVIFPSTMEAVHLGHVTQNATNLAQLEAKTVETIAEFVMLSASHSIVRVGSYFSAQAACAGGIPKPFQFFLKRRS